MADIIPPHALLATLIETPAAVALAEQPACQPHWKVKHANGALLVADTTQPLQDGVAALIAQGYVSDNSESVVLWLAEQGRSPFGEMTVQQVLALTPPVEEPAEQPVEQPAEPVKQPA
ncbi:hypothetical protein [Paracoccus yeei]|uniref:hypothetical protein n=1 Tax=Paracoccus yeei TaxID=147645 RepID=UPI003BF7E0CB